MKRILFLFICLSTLCSGVFAQGFIDAAEFGFLPTASGIENRDALQKAVDKTGTIVVSQTGDYKIAGTVYLGSNTTLRFGNNIRLVKVNEEGDFSHVLINKGAATRTFDQNIVVEGLEIVVNGMDVRKFKEAYGLHGQLAFFYVKDLLVERFRCYDLGKAQYGIHICTFEDAVVDDAIIYGMKDGVHLGKGNRFRISNCVFQTFDDAIALNAHDYAVGNPEYGWIENGVVENCHDLNQEKTTGYFCRILAGAWVDWKEGMEVQQSDVVVSGGRMYRVQMASDGRKFITKTRPEFTEGTKEIDGINWGIVQQEQIYTCGVRNVVFRDIFLHKPRIGFSVHFDNDKYSRSYYPGAQVPVQEQLLFDNVRVLHNEGSPFLSINTPMDIITITNSSFRRSGIRFHGNGAMKDYLRTKINISNCNFNLDGKMCLVSNSVPGKKIELKTTNNNVLHDSFVTFVDAGEGEIKVVSSDLDGLK